VCQSINRRATRIGEHLGDSPWLESLAGPVPKHADIEHDRIVRQPAHLFQKLGYRQPGQICCAKPHLIAAELSPSGGRPASIKIAAPINTHKRPGARLQSKCGPAGGAEEGVKTNPTTSGGSRRSAIVPAFTATKITAAPGNRSPRCSSMKARAKSPTAITTS